METIDNDLNPIITSFIAEILKINTPVKYVAFGVNDNLIELQGNLVITLGSNPNSSSINRIIITNAELVLK